MYNELYLNDLKENIDNLNFDFLKNKSILITGAGGLICSYIVDALMYSNELYDYNIGVYALGRNRQNLEKRFPKYKNSQNFHIVEQDVCMPINLDNIGYIIHGAGNANPKLYFTDPVGTMLGNFMGMYNVLELARKNKSKVIYISSSEVYGDMKGANIPWKEEESGYINVMNYRSCYPNSKRASEGLCSSYHFQHSVDTFVIRLCHIYGPTMTNGDNRAVSAFMRNVINNEDIIMKSNGTAIRSYCYVADAFRAIMLILSKGVSGETYNFSSESNVISIKDLATIIAKTGNKKVIIDLPEQNEGYNTIEKTIMSEEKLKGLGWEPKYSVEKGIEICFNILKEKID